MCRLLKRVLGISLIAVALSVVVSGCSIASSGGEADPAADSSAAALATQAITEAIGDPTPSPQCDSAILAIANLNVDWDAYNDQWKAVALANASCFNQRTWMASFVAQRTSGYADPAAAINLVCRVDISRHINTDVCTDWMRHTGR